MKADNQSPLLGQVSSEETDVSRAGHLSGVGHEKIKPVSLF